MSNPYSTLSSVYEAMYQSFINYKDEFDFYYNILRQCKVASLLEVEFGTGHLFVGSSPSILALFLFRNLKPFFVRQSHQKSNEYRLEKDYALLNTRLVIPSLLNIRS